MFAEYTSPFYSHEKLTCASFEEKYFQRMKGEKS